MCNSILYYETNVLSLFTLKTDIYHIIALKTLFISRKRLKYEFN